MEADSVVAAMEATEAAMEAWLRENSREKRPAHVYGPERFGFSEYGLAADFAAYRERFVLPARG